jgi:hypothetical protein
MNNNVMAISDELEKLIALRNSGEISAEEFETLKRKLINPGTAETQTVNVEIKKKKSLGCFGVGCISIILLFLVFGIIGANSRNNADSASDGASSSATSEIENTAPAITDTPEELRAALIAELGDKTNMDVPRDLEVELSGENGDETFIQLVMNDGFSNQLARSSAFRDTAKAIAITQASTFAKDMTITFTTEMFDANGASLGQTNAITLWFDEEAFSKIVPDNLVGEEMWTGAATSVFIHPVLLDD